MLVGIRTWHDVFKHVNVGKINIFRGQFCFRVPSAPWIRSLRSLEDHPACTWIALRQILVVRDLPTAGAWNCCWHAVKFVECTHQHVIHNDKKISHSRFRRKRSCHLNTKPENCARLPSDSFATSPTDVPQLWAILRYPGPPFLDRAYKSHNQTSVL